MSCVWGKCYMVLTEIFAAVKMGRQRNAIARLQLPGFLGCTVCMLWMNKRDEEGGGTQAKVRRFLGQNFAVERTRFVGVNGREATSFERVSRSSEPFRAVPSCVRRAFFLLA